MSQSFQCPHCEAVTTLPSDVAAGYCPRCRWWTGDSLLGSPEVMAQAAIDGPIGDPSYIYRTLADQFAEHHRRSLEAAAFYLPRFAAALGEAITPILRRAVEAVKMFSEACERAGLVRRTEKRLRHERVVVRYKLVPQPQPRPWKVDR